MKTDQLTANLKKWLAELAELKSRTSKLEAKVFAHTFEWVERVREENAGLRDVRSALKAFADTFKVTVNMASQYYYSGRYMSNNRLDQEIVDHGAVRIAQLSDSKMTKAGRLKVLDAVRKGQPRTKVAAIVRDAVNQKLKRSEKKADDLEKAGKLTLNQVRVEALAFLTLAQKYFGDGARVEVKIGDKLKLKVGAD